MIYGLDMLYAPTPAAAATMWHNGWRWLCCYIGGPRAAAGHHGWSNGAVHILANQGFVFLPTYVGRTWPYDPAEAFSYTQGLLDADDANVLTGACGFNETTPLCLDAEYGDFQNAPGFSEYVRGFAERVNAAGHQLCLYSDVETLNAFDSSTVDLKWGAAWTGRNLTSKPPFGRFDPATPPPWDAWQFGGTTIAGVSVDQNSARDDFPFAQYSPG